MGEPANAATVRLGIIPDGQEGEHIKGIREEEAGDILDVGNALLDDNGEILDIDLNCRSQTPMLVAGLSVMLNGSKGCAMVNGRASPLLTFNITPFR